MFWRHDEEQMETALVRFGETLDLTENSKSKLTNLTDWLAESRQQAREEWSHEELFESLMSEQEFDKDAIVQEVHDSLRTLEEFATTLIDKLADFHSTLTDEQKARLSEEFGQRGKEHRGWSGWHRRHRLKHRLHHRVHH